MENASGYDYHGYNASNMSKFDKRYKSEDVTFQSLIDAALAKGMKVILYILTTKEAKFYIIQPLLHYKHNKFEY